MPICLQSFRKLSSESMAPLLAALLLLLPVLILIIKRSTTSRSSHNEQRLPPCPPKLPVLGNMHQLGSLPHQSLRALSTKHGALMMIMLGQVPALVVSSASTAKEILRTHDHIFASRPSIKVARIIFNGGIDILFSPYGEHWRQIKKLCVSRLLSPTMVQSFRAVREQEVASLVTKIHEMSSSSINMSEVLGSFMSRLLCRVLFGDYLGGEGSFKLICRLIDEMSAVIARFSFADCIPSLGWLDKLTGLESMAKLNFREWDSLLEDIVKEHEEKGSAGAGETSDFTDVLLALQTDGGVEMPLSRVVIKTILLDMVAGGIDGPLLVLDWGMAELARNPATMRRLQEEVRGAAGAGSAVREEDVGKMSYLRAVIKEVMRLHPPAPLLIPHESMDRCTIHGYEIPKQTRVIVNAWAIGRDPETWEDPEEFRPERFVGSGVDFRGGDFELIPFGAGRRMCPGIQFATAALELAFANLVSVFDWELPGGMRCEDLDMSDSPGVTTRRRQPLYLVATPPNV